MDKEWKNRKEHTTSLSFGSGFKTVLYDNQGRRTEGIGNTKEEAREKAYKRWDEKYR